MASSYTPMEAQEHYHPRGGGPLKYGYGADLRYAALQGGVNFTALEGHNTTTTFQSCRNLRTAFFHSKGYEKRSEEHH
nr:hypothetical protein [Bartonella sp. AU55XJBT]